MSFTSEEGGFLQPLLEGEVVDDAGGTVPSEGLATAEAETPISPSRLRKSRSRKMSLYHEESKWSDNRQRHLYLNDLLLQRQQAIKNIFPEEDRDEEEGGFQDSAQKISNKMHAAFVHNLQSFVEDEDTSVLPSVAIRVKNFSFDVPLSQTEADGKIKIPTVFNNSPIYWCMKAAEKVMRRKKIESEIRRKEVKRVLSGVNLALDPGKMYLIIGPPSSGKTSLLNGKHFSCVTSRAELLLLIKSLTLSRSLARCYYSYRWQATGAFARKNWIFPKEASQWTSSHEQFGMLWRWHRRD